MAVVATAGHVDHGKSTLVRLLTGMEPDRWAEEQRRGLTIDLGYAWTDLDGVRVSLVDVPGHERFTPSMLAGLGPVAGVVLVVAADDGWGRQTEEHARAMAALALRHVLLVVTRCDLADGARAAAQARDRLETLGLSGGAGLLVSGRTGAGLPDLRAALRSFALEVSAADVQAPVRLWADRAFTITGAGTVVTGTLAAGTVAVEDELVLRGQRVRVRGLQTCGQQVEAVAAPARVAVNLRAVPLEAVARGDVLLSPDHAPAVAVVDVELHRPWVPPGDRAPRLPREAVLHVGTAAVPVRVQVLPDGRVRLRPAVALPVVLGDRAVLRDPGRHEVLAGVRVVVTEPRRRGSTRPGRSATTGPPVAPAAAEDGGAGSPGLVALLAWLGEHPLDAPSAGLLQGWSVTAHELALAQQRGELLRLAGLVLGADAVDRAAEVVGRLPDGFSAGTAARAMGTSRRVAIPLLERLDATLVTRRFPDGTRSVR